MTARVHRGARISPRSVKDMPAQPRAVQGHAFILDSLEPPAGRAHCSCLQWSARLEAAACVARGMRTLRDLEAALHADWLVHEIARREIDALARGKDSSFY